MEASQLAAGLRRILRGNVKVNEPLKPLTTLRIGGPADVLLVPAGQADVVAAVRWAAERAVPLWTLGAGSNVLVPDEGLRGIVMRTRPALDYIRFNGHRVRVGSGASVARLVAQASQRGLAGAEGLAGVPGSVGGALVMNAGTHGGNIGSRVVWVRAVDRHGRVLRLTPDDLGFGYRRSVFQDQPLLVLGAELELEAGDAGAIRGRVDQALQYRNRTQPLHLPNAGSTFKNPPGDAAGRLIEAAGCKGLRRGDAQISTMHANWVVNLGEARAVDVVDLMVDVRRAVWDRFTVALEPELRLLAHLADRWREGIGGLGPSPSSPG